MPCTVHTLPAAIQAIHAAGTTAAFQIVFTERHIVILLLTPCVTTTITAVITEVLFNL